MNGSFADCAFRAPRGVCIDRMNPKRLYASDYHSIRCIDMDSGMVSLLAGSSESGNMDESRSAARFSSPIGVIMDQSMNDALLVADSLNAFDSSREAQRMARGVSCSKLSGIRPLSHAIHCSFRFAAADATPI